MHWACTYVHVCVGWGVVGCGWVDALGVHVCACVCGGVWGCHSRHTLGEVTACEQAGVEDGWVDGVPLPLCFQITLQPGELEVNGLQEVATAVLLQYILDTVIQNSLHTDSERGRGGKRGVG